jgi:hypothetical protein
MGLVLLMALGADGICSQFIRRECDSDVVRIMAEQQLQRYSDEYPRQAFDHMVTFRSGVGLQSLGGTPRKKLEDQFLDDFKNRRYQAGGFVERLMADLSLAGPGATAPQFSGRKSETELARMTPEQHVQEYCEEYHNHEFWDHEYTNLLESYVLRDGMEAVPILIKILDQFDPGSSKGRSRVADAWCFAAEGLLSQLDERCIRLQATDEGRKAIEAMEGLVKRLQSAGEKSPQGNNYLRRSEGPRILLRYMKGINGTDIAIQYSLKTEHKIALSDSQMLTFVTYLINHSPSYPARADVEIYRDPSDVNQGGYPKLHLILKDAERLYRLYLEYQEASQPGPKRAGS